MDTKTNAGGRTTLRIVVCMLVLALGMALSGSWALADDGDAPSNSGTNLRATNLTDQSASAKRTVMFYVCGSDLEEDSGMASINLRQVLDSNFGNGEDVRVIVMTGGSCQWYLEREKLVFPEGVTVPTDAVQRGNPNFDDEVTTLNDPRSEISGPYNQIWEAKSQNATDNPGKLVLLDGNGLKDGRADTTKEWMSDPATLKGFINYCVQNYPAEKYDLVLWDHGGGTTGGFALDSRRPNSGIAGDTMSFAQIIGVLKDNEVTKQGDNDSTNDSQFDFVNFDACLMGSTEIALALADYTDYLLVSPETVPGRGQVYKGWLDKLGENPDARTYELGRKLVDDFVAYYNEDHEGHVHQEGTMALINTKALLKSDFVSALNTVGDALKTQVENGKFYDELRSVKDSIKYSGAEFYDLGNLVSLLGISLWELDPAAVNNSAVDYSSAYTDAAQTLLEILENPEIVYAGNTSGINKQSRFFMNAAAKDNTLNSSGLHLFFPLNGTDLAVIEYGDAIKAAAEAIPQDDGRANFLRNYVHAMYEYNFVQLAGRSVTEMVNSGKNWTPFGYDELQAYWKQPIYPNLADVLPDYTHYIFHAKPLFEAMDGDKTNSSAEATEAEVATWLDGVVKQQALEAVSADNVTAKSFVTKGGTGSKVTIANTRRRAMDSVRMDVVAELPAARAYIAKHDEPISDPTSVNYDPESMLSNLVEEGAADLPLGSVQATRDASMDAIEDSTGDFLRDYVNWFNNASTTTWNIDPLHRKWYAVKDAEGLLHVAYNEGGSTTASVPVIRMRKGEVGNDPELNVLKFKDGKLTQILLHDDDGTSRVISASDLKTNLQYMSALYAGTGIGATILPASNTSFTLTPDNVDDIELVYTDVSNIKDIADVDGDGDSFERKYTVSDIYGANVDISTQVNNPVGELVDIRLVEVEPATYTGKELKPTVTHGGKTLVEGVDYILENDSGRPLVQPGEYDITLWGIGDYADMLIATFVVKPTENDMAAATQAQIAIVAALAKIDAGALEAGDAQALATADAALATYNELTDAQKSLIDGPVMMALLSVSQKAAAARAALADAETNAAKKAQAKADSELATAKESVARNVKTVTVNAKVVTAAIVSKAIVDVGGDPKYVTTIVLGPKVKSIKAFAFAKCPKVKTLQVQTKKFKKKAVKKSLKGSKVKRIIVNVPNAKVHAKLVKKYKKIFTKKVCGKKVKVQ